MTAGIPKPQVDTGRPHPARVYDHLLGGKDHYLVDSRVAEQLPPEAANGARHNRAFMTRAVAHLARQGIDQFLDIGTGIPTAPNLHQVVQGINPRARIVYTDNDPIVLRHAEALLISTPEGGTDYIEADVREPGRILSHARDFLDFDRPLALSLVALMHFIPEEQDPYGIVATLVDALPSGSCLVLSNAGSDVLPEIAAKVTGEYARGGIRLAFRTRAEVARFFDGLELIGPGLTTAHEWSADGPAPEAAMNSGMHAGVARVP
ncbi:SAM-dependent methyltransferase [Streptomyces sp. NPDC047002]|uniref:SAM-dependent methyltransferase n=1 Tax=Streptomyces sp. NPDC047002 TaxID=3155475 RepID=UPI003455772E